MKPLIDPQNSDHAISKSLRHPYFSVYLISALTLLVHICTSNRLGYLMDEIYNIDLSRRLAFGYADMPPLVPFLIRVTHIVLGDSLLALRMLPALGHCATVLLAGRIAGELGGKAFSRTLASLCVMISPGLLRMGGVFVVPALEPAIWTFVAYLLLLLIKHDRPILWILIGLMCGIGLMTKLDMLLFGVGLTIALAITPMRSQFFSRWIWLGGLIAITVALPNLLWQNNHQWITFQLAQAANNSHWAHLISWKQLLFGQLLYLNPLVACLWIAGIFYFLFSRDAKPYRLFGWLYIFVSFLFCRSGSKCYYLIPLFPVPIAAGSVQLESWRVLTRSSFAQAGILGTFILAGILMAPVGLPLLPPRQYDYFAKAVSLGIIDGNAAPDIFLLYWEMSGKRRNLLLGYIASAYESLSAAEKARTTLLARRFLDAAPINVLGSTYGLPPCICSNLDYDLAGPGEHTGEITIAIGYDPAFLRSVFGDVVDVPMPPKVASLAFMPAIYICRQPIQPLGQMWGRFKSIFPYEN